MLDWRSKENIKKALYVKAQFHTYAKIATTWVSKRFFYFNWLFAFVILTINFIVNSRSLLISKESNHAKNKRFEKGVNCRFFLVYGCLVFSRFSSSLNLYMAYSNAWLTSLKRLHAICWFIQSIKSLSMVIDLRIFCMQLDSYMLSL